MKRYLFLIAIALLVFIPGKVMAATELTQSVFDQALSGTPSNGVSYDDTEEYYALESGEYTLTENISLDDKELIISGTVTLDLNGKDITSSNISRVIKIIENAVVTIKGSGSIQIVDLDAGCAIQAYNNANLTIMNGTFNAVFGIVVYDNSKVTVNGGTISELTIYQNATATVNSGEIPRINTYNTSKITINNGSIDEFFIHGYNESEFVTVLINKGKINDIVSDHADITIVDGEFVNEGRPALNILSGNNVVIKGGTFIADELAAVLVGNPDNKSIKISGGTFKGALAGILFWGEENLELTGGKFEATDSSNAYGAITCMDTTDKSVLTSILGNGYIYNPTLIASVGEDEYGTDLVSSQLAIEVIPIETEKTPTTFDNISTYISIAIIATLGLGGAILTKKIIKN